ncbi:hypothetical protein EHS13_30045 [Paenibacillus psychroresistens]|uniref:TcaA protein NTF2-like domain-containing protein n=1 Tax=Paenibacillus psychroresistens TaxID=1778678 RepID=A0A6B8RS99_9BACL|nr:hypothetical protein [Paenibacillus psychroresistens]QGQ98819.1 hypothetical protein EHS13_30045 [Paenibacillus psychroresistens]
MWKMVLLAILIILSACDNSGIQGENISQVSELTEKGTPLVSSKPESSVTKEPNTPSPSSVEATNINLIESFIDFYIFSWANAVNENDFDSISASLVEGSELYNSEKSYIQESYNKGIKITLLDNVDETQKIGENEYKSTVTMNVEIIEQDNKSTQTFKKVFIVTKLDQERKIKQIENIIDSISESTRWIDFSTKEFLSERKLVQDFYKDEINEIRKVEGSNQELDFSMALEDLNSDGVKEIIVALHDLIFTGANSNSNIQIFEVVNGKLQDHIIGQAYLALDENGHQKELGILNSESNKWKDITLNKDIFKWDGQNYQ